MPAPCNLPRLFANSGALSIQCRKPPEERHGANNAEQDERPCRQIGLARRGSGVVLASNPVDAAAQIELPPAPPVRIVGERRLGLWDRPLSLLVVLVLISRDARRIMLYRPAMLGRPFQARA